jgi:hypothetical protein
VHGGLSPSMNSLDQVQVLLDSLTAHNAIQWNLNIAVSQTFPSLYTICYTFHLPDSNHRPEAGGAPWRSHVRLIVVGPWR